MNTCTNTIGWKLAQEKTKKYKTEQKNIRIEQYNNAPSKCKFCNNSLSYDKRNCKFCDNSCAASFNNKGKNRHLHIPNKNINASNTELYCLYCAKKLTERTQKKFCNYICNRKFQNNIESTKKKKLLDEWKQGKIDGGTWRGVMRYVRSYIFDKYNSKCCICGWGELNAFTGRIPLDIDHIDGNPCNHNEDNLRLLCKNCHSLTSTYGGSNRGNGRKERSNLDL